MKKMNLIISICALAVSAACLVISATGTFREAKPKKTEAEITAKADLEESIMAEREKAMAEYVKNYNEICEGKVRIYDYETGTKITVSNKPYGREYYTYDMDFTVNSCKTAYTLPAHLQSEDVNELSEGEVYLIAEMSVTSHSGKDEIYMMNSIKCESGNNHELQYSSGREFIGSARAHYELHPEEAVTSELVFIIREECKNDFTIVIDNCGTANYCGHTVVLNIKAD